MTPTTILEAIRTLLSKAQAEANNIPLTANNRDKIHHLQMALAFLQERLSNPYAILVGRDCANAIQDRLNSIERIVEILVDRPDDPNLWANYASCVNQLFNQISSVPFLSKPRNRKDTSPADGLLTYERRVEQYVEELEGVVSRNSESARETETQMENLQQEVDQLNKNISEFIDKKRREFGEQRDTWSDEFRGFLKEQDTAATDQQKSFERNISALKEQWQNQFDTLRKTEQEAYDNGVKNLSRLHEEQERKAAECLSKLREILGLASVDSMSGSSRLYANAHNKRGVHLFRVSMGIMVVAALASTGIILWTILAPQSGASPLLTLGIRFLFITPFILPAWYCACESRREANLERQYREFEIKISAINPYLNDVIQEGKDPVELPQREKAKIELLKYLITAKAEKDKENITIPREWTGIIHEFIRKIPSSK